MSDRFGTPRAQSLIADLQRIATKKRTLAYAGGALVAVLVLAWIDAGEEPLHPIVHRIASPVANGGGQ